MSENTYPSYRISDLDANDRPRERLVRLGPGSLTNAELLAILLRSGTKGENVLQMGQRLLQIVGGLVGLHRASIEDICAQHGIGPAKATQLKAAIELGNRLRIEAPEERPEIHSPSDTAALVEYEMSALEQEEMRVILLDTRNRVLSIVNVYRGSVNSSQIRVGELFREAIRKNAPSIILVHNHPSGDPTPSTDDIAVTRATIQAGRLLDIRVLDHLIIGQGRYLSLLERRPSEFE